MQAMKNIMSPPRSTVQIFTDASVRKGRLGIGVFSLQQCTGVAGRVKISRGTCQFDSNFGEMTAIWYALHSIDKYAPVSIHTDSQNTLDHILYNKHPRNEYHRRLHCHLREIINSRHDYTWFYKVKAHSGVYGNEVADKLARRGTMLDAEQWEHTPRLQLGELDLGLYTTSDII